MINLKKYSKMTNNGKRLVLILVKGDLAAHAIITKNLIEMDGGAKTVIDTLIERIENWTEDGKIHKTLGIKVK